MSIITISSHFYREAFFSAKQSNRKVMLQGDNKDTSISVRLINVCKTVSLLFLILFFYFR